MDEQITEPTANQQRVSLLDLLLIIRAYNRHEITYKEWLKFTKEWAEAVIKEYGEGH